MGIERKKRNFEPLAVSPKEACKLLSIGTTQLYELLSTGALESYKQGNSRRIMMRSIKVYVQGLLETSEKPKTFPRVGAHIAHPPEYS